jgi:hypothetical protein
MLKFSGYPYLIRGQPLNGKGLTAVGRRIPAADMLPQRWRTDDSAEDIRARGEAAAPNTKPGLSGVMTLEQACPPEYRGAQCAFKDSMIH